MQTHSFKVVAEEETKARGIVLLGIFLGLFLIVPAAWAVWTFKDRPLQPSHAASATVVAIAPTQGRSNRQTIVVRNAHGFGSISVLIGTARCDVGDKVQVIQRGTTLSAAPSTCR